MRTVPARLLAITVVSLAVLIGVLANEESASSPSDWVVSGTVEVGGLSVEGAVIAMGQVALDVTHVPAWTITNPTSKPIVLRVPQPQVVVGCCPGPVIIGETVITPDDDVIVGAGESVHLAFPLQMHAGMDGPHHLLVPLEVGRSRAVLEVIADFTGRARP